MAVVGVKEQAAATIHASLRLFQFVRYCSVITVRSLLITILVLQFFPVASTATARAGLGVSS